MRIKNEDEILKAEVRKKIIEEIEGPENKRRKYSHFRKAEIYKDRIKYFVIKTLSKQFDQNTLREMEYAISNLNLCKSVIDKLSQVYTHGVQRKITDDEGKTLEEPTKILKQVEDELCINEIQKTTNRMLKLHHNAVQYVKPCPEIEDGVEYNDVNIQTLAPYLYDVVEDYYNRTKPMVFILSNYEYVDLEYSVTDAAREGRNFRSPQNVLPPLGDGKDQKIADAKEDETKDGASKYKEYIWWTKNYHFTTDQNGDIVGEEKTVENPIATLPFVNYAIDQDNSFWANGGDDIIDGTIVVNALISHLHHIAITQGYGQFWMKGKNLPRNIVFGPSKAILMEYEQEEPVPDIGFANATPNLTGIMDMVEMYVALLLTTNKLSTSNVSTQLNGSVGFPSAIAMMLDKSVSMEDIQDQRQIFIDKEPELFELINKWVQLFAGEGTLDPSLEGMVLPEDFNLNLIFNQNQVMQTEKEKIENLEARKALGFNTMIELMKMDQPDLTDEEAEEKLLEIAEEKTKRMLDAMATSGGQLDADGKPIPQQLGPDGKPLPPKPGVKLDPSKKDDGKQPPANLPN